MAQAPSLCGRRRACLLGLCVFAACTTSPASAALRGGEVEQRQLNVFGYPDRRRPADPFSHPAHSIGRLQFPDGMFCTGALIGPQHVLTARHCFTDEAQQQVMLGRMKGTFRTGVHHTNFADEAVFEHVWYGMGEDDWAIIRINQALGDKWGYLPVRNVSDPVSLVSKEKNYRMFGYSTDKYAYVLGEDPACALVDYVIAIKTGAEMYMTSCSGEAGSSGAPILDESNQVVAIFVAAIDHVGTPKVRVIGDFDRKHPNFATPSAAFFPKYASLPGIVLAPAPPAPPSSGDGGETGVDTNVVLDSKAQPSFPDGDTFLGNQTDSSYYINSVDKPVPEGTPK